MLHRPVSARIRLVEKLRADGPGLRERLDGGIDEPADAVSLRAHRRDETFFFRCRACVPTTLVVRLPTDGPWGNTIAHRTGSRVGPHGTMACRPNRAEPHECGRQRTGPASPRTLQVGTVASSRRGTSCPARLGCRSASHVCGGASVSGSSAGKGSIAATALPPHPALASARRERTSYLEARCIASTPPRSAPTP